MDPLFQVVTEKCKTTGFLEMILEKAHYVQEDRALLWSVCEQVLASMEGAGWSSSPVPGAGGRYSEVVITLGRKVDELQEAYLRDGKLSEAYMVEVLGSEILLVAYGAYNAWIGENTENVVKRYHFLGTPAEAGGLPCGLEELPGILERSGLPVTCTEGYCMVPKKSVAFYAELTGDRTTVCEGICMGCGRKDCPNRMDAGDRLQGNRTLDHPLTYGYMRIFGLKG